MCLLYFLQIFDLDQLLHSHMRSKSLLIEKMGLLLLQSELVVAESG